MLVCKASLFQANIFFLQEMKEERRVRGGERE
jgi:hypothetical protein